jgi:DUF4097 and DUF4098 domain-containing protein YvlB
MKLSIRMSKTSNRAQVATLLILAGSLVVAAETRQELHFKVGKKPSVSINNQYGPISVKAGASKEVSVTAVIHSDKVEVDQSHRGNRVDIVSHLLPGADSTTGQVDYEVTVPADADVTLTSMTGPLHAERLQGDVVMEGNTAVVDVRDVSEGHVHVKTLNGPVTLSGVRDGHVEVTSLGGDVILTSVNGPLVQVNSSSGKISYDGNFGEGGEYSLTTHTGDIEATAPSYASIDVTARSVQGQVVNDFQLEPKHTSFIVKEGSAFAGTVGKAASSVKLFSFSGKIHLKKR